MSYTIPMDFSAFLVLSAMGAGFGAYWSGPIVALWSFLTWWQKSTWTTKRPRWTSANPRPRSKGPKDQKDHACNTRSHGNG
jgi:hypothetical protein